MTTNTVFPTPLALLAQSFPTLRLAPIVEPASLWEWAQSGKSSGEYHAAVFILNVWNSSPDTPWPRFDVMAAYAVWDRAHKRAFAGWALAPG